MINILLFVTFDDGREDAGEVAMLFNLIQFVGFNKLRDDGPVLRAGVMPCKKFILAPKGDGVDRSLDGVAMHLNPAMGQEQGQAIPVFRDVFEHLDGWRFGRDLSTLNVLKFFEGLELWGGFSATDGKELVGCQTLCLTFGPIECCGLRLIRFSDGCCVAFGQLKQFSTCMCPTVGQLDRFIVPLVKHKVIYCINVHLQDAAEALQGSGCAFSKASQCIGKRNTRRFWPRPRPTITGQCPGIPFLHLPLLGSSTGAGVLSMNSLVDVFRCLSKAS